ncbi:hypothetical protein [Pseudomonas sp. URMO17WK12:I11]|uniref:hypothetical protein n=1 Tax=Pseudomonas sp. URMO17WK12:I11 TaxID=1283291 RepID=UPI0011A06BE2|nr:hypothetical protein [Pseudomonas sp. URMO17WK12:I11]
MSVSESQLSQVDRQMDQNHREMVIMSIEDFQAQTQFAQRTHRATQSPHLCTRTQGDWKNMRRKKSAISPARLLTIFITGPSAGR